MPNKKVSEEHEAYPSRGMKRPQDDSLGSAGAFPKQNKLDYEATEIPEADGHAEKVDPDFHEEKLSWDKE